MNYTLIIDTDGYIEAGIYVQEPKEGGRFQKCFISSGEQDLKAYIKNRKDCRTKPVLNKKHKNVEVLVMELFDRSRSKDAGL